MDVACSPDMTPTAAMLTLKVNTMFTYITGNKLMKLLSKTTKGKDANSTQKLSLGKVSFVLTGSLSGSRCTPSLSGHIVSLAASSDVRVTDPGATLPSFSGELDDPKRSLSCNWLLGVDAILNCYFMSQQQQYWFLLHVKSLQRNRPTLRYGPQHLINDTDIVSDRWIYSSVMRYIRSSHGILLNEWIQFYIADVSCRRLFRALNIKSNLECYHSNSNSVSWEIYSWAAIEAHQAIFHSKQIRLMCQVLTHCGFSGVPPDGNCDHVYWGSFTSNSRSVRRAILFTWFSEPHDSVCGIW